MKNTEITDTKIYIILLFRMKFSLLYVHGICSGSAGSWIDTVPYIQINQLLYITFFCKSKLLFKENIKKKNQTN